jgi:hypothetical protein
MSCFLSALGSILQATLPSRKKPAFPAKISGLTLMREKLAFYTTRNSIISNTSSRFYALAQASATLIQLLACIETTFF